MRCLVVDHLIIHDYINSLCPLGPFCPLGPLRTFRVGILFLPTWKVRKSYIQIKSF